MTVKSDDSTGEGYYWAGAAASGSDLVIGDESGYVKLIDGSTGDIKSSVKLSGAPIRSTVVYAGTEDGKQTYLVVTRQPATMYKIVRDGDTLSIATTADGKQQLSCEFANISTSTPAVANGKAYIGGSDSTNSGVFTVVDLASMKVEKTLDMGKKAEVKASPIASVQGSDVYVYFTCNKTPGAVYCFNQSTGEAVEIYTPSGSNANYCTASVIADARGNLYYTNDSGTLFALKAAPGYTVAFDTRGGSTVPSAMTAQNKTMVAPANPERSGYTFADWYKDADCTQAWDFSKDVVTADMTLYAKWTKNESPVPSPVPSSRPVSTKGNASSTSLVLTSHATVSLAGVLKSNAARQTGEHESLLAGFDSDELETSVEKSSDRGAVVVTAKKKKVDLPIWPFIGIALGVCVIVLAVLKRKKQGGE